MLENTPPFNAEDQTDTEFNQDRKRTNSGAVSHWSEEENNTLHSKLFVRDNYLVENFCYEFGVCNQLQGTRIVLSNGSKCCRYSELRNPKVSKHPKSSLACQIYYKTGRKTICEICGRPTILCVCRSLESSVESLDHSMSDDENFCELTECEYEEELECSNSIVKNQQIVYLIQNVQRPACGMYSGERMRNSGMNTCRIPIKCNYKPPEKGVRCGKMMQQSPFFRSGGLKMASCDRGNKMTNASIGEHCVKCTKSIGRCVCVRPKSNCQKEMGRGRGLPPQRSCKQRVPVVQTRNKTPILESRQPTLTQKTKIPKAITHVNDKNDFCPRINPEPTQNMDIQDKPEQNHYEESESSISRVDDDKKGMCKMNETDEKNKLPYRRNYSDCEETKQCLEILEPKNATSTSLCKPTGLLCKVIQETVNDITSSKQLMRDETPDNEAPHEYKIILTIRKRSDLALKLNPRNCSNKQRKLHSEVGYENRTSSPNTEDFETKRVKRDLTKKSKSESTVKRSAHSSPHSTQNEKQKLSNSALKCREVYIEDSERSVVGKLSLQSMKEKERTLLVSKCLRHISRNNPPLNLDEGRELGDSALEKCQRKDQMELEFPQIQDKKGLCELYSSIPRKLSGSRENVCVVSTDQLEKKKIPLSLSCEKRDTTETSSTKCINRNETFKSDDSSRDEAIIPENRRIAENRTQDAKNENVFLYEKYRYLSKHDWMPQMNDRSAELSEMLVPEKKNSCHLTVSCCIGGNSMKPSSSSTGRNIDTSKIICSNFCDIPVATSKILEHENIRVSSIYSNSSNRFSTRTIDRTKVVYEKRPTSRREFGKKQMCIYRSPGEKNRKKTEDPPRQCTKPQSRTKTKQSDRCQTGGTIEQDLIASFIASCTLNPDIRTSQECIIQSLFHQFAAKDLVDRGTSQCKNISPVQTRNNDGAHSSKYSIFMRSTKIQVGPSCPPKSEETQTVTAVVVAESNSIPSRTAPPRILHKKFNYVCGHDTLGFKTKISMNVDQLLSPDKLNKLKQNTTPPLGGRKTEPIEYKTSSNVVEIDKETASKKIICELMNKGMSTETYPCNPSNCITSETADAENGIRGKPSLRCHRDSVTLKNRASVSWSSTKPMGFVCTQENNTCGNQDQLKYVRKNVFRTKLDEQNGKRCDGKRRGLDSFDRKQNNDHRFTFRSAHKSGSFRQPFPDSLKSILLDTACDPDCDTDVMKQEIHRKYSTKRKVLDDCYEFEKAQSASDIINWSVDNTCSIESIVVAGNKSSNDVYVCAHDQPKGAKQVCLKEKVKRNLNQTDYFALNSAVNEFFKMKTENYL